MRLRPDFRAAVSLKNCPHRRSSEEIAEPTPPQQYRMMALFLKRFHGGTGTRPKAGGAHDKFYRGHFFFFVAVGFVLQLMAIHCNRRVV